MYEVSSGDPPRSEDTSWQNLANCWWIPPREFMPGQSSDIEAAKAVCGGCVVRADCLESDLQHGVQPGVVRAGLTEEERRAILQQRSESASGAEAQSPIPEA